MSKETKKEEVKTPKETKKEAKGVEYEVSSPEIARPKELPLVIKPKGGKWANDAQAEYANTLNGYAYANPEKWEEKKDVLLKRLESIGENPKNIINYRGNVGRVAYNNKLIQ